MRIFVSRLPASIPCIHRRRGGRGITLIEVLVSVIILSIGLLGIAGLQAATTKYKINTWSRSAISALYADIADRIRINSDAAGSSFIAGDPSTSLYTLNATWSTQRDATLTTPSPNCETAACTSEERAAFDMMVWRQRVRASMPQGAGLLSGTKKDGFELTLMWFDKEYVDKGQDASSVLVTTPACTGSETGMAQQSCCPAAAEVVAGVRCARFSFIP